MRVNDDVHDEAGRLHHGDRDERARSHQQGCRRAPAQVPPGAAVAVQPLQREQLNDDGQDEERYAVRHRVRPGVEHFMHAPLRLCSAVNWRVTYRTTGTPATLCLALPSAERHAHGSYQAIQGCRVPDREYRGPLITTPGSSSTPPARLRRDLPVPSASASLYDRPA